MDDNSIKHFPVIKVMEAGNRNTSDMLAVEPPPPPPPPHMALQYLDFQRNSI